MEARGATDGERKTITALFADLAGFTALARDLDPEDTRRIIDPALKVMMDAVHRYEGYVAQSLGDGVFALFGAPIAHEDHPQRAVYAALRMQDELRRYADRIRLEKGVPLQIRVGINTGEVVLRSIHKDDLHTDYVPVGHSTNLAARMEGLANPGSIVVSEQTYRLTEGYFAFTALGAVQVKGLEEAVNVYEVLGVGPLRTKLQVAARRGLVRFVGRQSELEQLKKALELAKAGHGQIVGVMGEPGVGKSRLFHEFVGAYCNTPLLLRLETFSVSHGKAYPYLPLIDLLKNYFHLALHDDERQRREKLTGRVLTLDRSLEDLLPYLFFLLGVAEPASPLQQMDPQIRRRRILEAIKRVLVRESLNQPLMVIFEDLHWLDSETQAFLGLLSESVATAKILLLVNYRPEYRHEWGQKTYHTQLRLDPLGQEDARELLTALLGDAPTLQPVKQFILEKTEGNPFFMEEIVQALFEQGVLLRGSSGVETRRSASLPSDLHLPATVQGVLTARIDRLLPDEKTLLQTLGVIGKEFSLSLLKSVVQQAEDDLLRQLSHLQAGEFIYERPAFPDVEYTFKHALTQEVAYNSLLQERRKILHERTAGAIEAVYRSRLEDHYSTLAHHYSRSGNTQKAVEYLQLAGQQAVQRSAHAEAIEHLTTALGLLKALPDTPARAQQELTLQITLGVSLMAVKGYAAPEAGHAYARARELCRQVGETPQLLFVLEGLCAFYLVGGELQTSREVAEQMLRLAQSVQDREFLVLAHAVLGEVFLRLEELDQSRSHFDQGIALYEPRQRGSRALHDPGVMCLSMAATTLWCLGYPDQAVTRLQEALRVAQERSHLFSLTFALHVAAHVHHLRREVQATYERVEALLTLGREQGFILREAAGMVYRGWVLAEQDQAEEGTAQIRRGLATWEAAGTEFNQSYYRAVLAEAYRKSGRAEEGLTVLADALAAIDRAGDRYYEAELYRLKGTLTLQSQASLEQVSSKSQASQDQSEIEKEAEECFLKAIEVARKQQAKSLELRAVMSLSRLWQQQGKKNEAQQLLANIYGWFTEGFDTKDLQEAKALLQELS
jgi:class 3 adenylate cyclase/predicted ATPase